MSGAARTLTSGGAGKSNEINGLGKVSEVSVFSPTFIYYVFLLSLEKGTLTTLTFSLWRLTPYKYRLFWVRVLVRESMAFSPTSGRGPVDWGLTTVGRCNMLAGYS